MLKRSSDSSNFSNEFPQTLIDAYHGSLPDNHLSLIVKAPERISNGAFGIVYKATVITDSRYFNREIYKKPECANEFELATISMTKFISSNVHSVSSPLVALNLAIKKVLQDERFKNRELQILRMIDHEYIIKLKFFFKVKEKNLLYLCLIFDYIPLTIFQYYKDLKKLHKKFCPHLLKRLMFQLIGALKYIHKIQICHRDIKPQNLLYDTEKQNLILADFGSAKDLLVGQRSVSYICSRHYRAPELILGNTMYTCIIDIWSFGCVMAEVVIFQPLFYGHSNVLQIAEIIRILGSPSNQDLIDMSPENNQKLAVNNQPVGLEKVIKGSEYESAIIFLKKVLVYSPNKRPNSGILYEDEYFLECRN